MKNLQQEVIEALLQFLEAESSGPIDPEAVFYADLGGLQLTRAQYKKELETNEEFLVEQFQLLKSVIPDKPREPDPKITITPAQQRLLAGELASYQEDVPPGKDVLNVFLSEYSILVRMYTYEDILLILDTLEFEKGMQLLRPSREAFEEFKADLFAW